MSLVFVEWPSLVRCHSFLYLNLRIHSPRFPIKYTNVLQIRYNNRKYYISESGHVVANELNDGTYKLVHELHLCNQQIIGNKYFSSASMIIVTMAIIFNIPISPRTYSYIDLYICDTVIVKSKNLNLYFLNITIRSYYLTSPYILAVRVSRIRLI